MSRRTERLNDLLREELSELLLRQVKDPRLGGLITITQVLVSADLRHARVYISVLGGEAEKREVMTALSSAASYLRRELRSHLTLRYTPDLSFFPDDSIENGARMLSLLNELKQQEPT